MCAWTWAVSCAPTAAVSCECRGTPCRFSASHVASPPPSPPLAPAPAVQPRHPTSAHPAAPGAPAMLRVLVCVQAQHSVPGEGHHLVQFHRRGSLDDGGAWEQGGCLGGIRGATPPGSAPHSTFAWTARWGSPIWLAATSSGACTPFAPTQHTPLAGAPSSPSQVAAKTWLATFDPKTTHAPDATDAKYLKEFLRRKYIDKEYVRAAGLGVLGLPVPLPRCWALHVCALGRARAGGVPRGSPPGGPMSVGVPVCLQVVPTVRPLQASRGHTCTVQ
jgi:hypothetical protein